MLSTTEEAFSDLQTAEIRKLKFPVERQLSQSSSVWCLEIVYASFCSNWTLNLKRRTWQSDQNRQAICHGLDRLVLTELWGRWVCENVFLHLCGSSAGEVMCWGLQIHAHLQTINFKYCEMHLSDILMVQEPVATALCKHKAVNCFITNNWEKLHISDIVMFSAVI